MKDIVEAFKQGKKVRAKQNNVSPFLFKAFEISKKKKY